MDPNLLTHDSNPLSCVSQARPEHALTAPIAADLGPLLDAARDYAADARAANTVRAYRSDWRHFSEFCDRRRLEPLPATAETVCAYLVDAAERYRTSTIGRRLVAIAQAHRLAGHPSPVDAPAVRLVWAGIRRRKGTRKEAKRALRTEELRRLLDACGAGLAGTRDRAILLMGFGACLRRSEVAALDVEDLRFGRDGVAVLVRSSKTDQEGRGEVVGVVYGARPQVCPVRSLRAWLAASGIEAGAVWRPVDRHGNLSPERLRGQALWRIVRRYAELVGLDASLYGAHSLRSGHATSAAAGGAGERAIMRQGRWKTEKMVRLYIQEANLFRDSSGGFLGL